MGNVWTVARHTIAESIRAKVFLVFLVLMGLILVGLPFSLSGDASLSGRVQNFMSFSLTSISFLLSILTILLSRTISDELAKRQILILMTKPIKRWQYIVGKWFGIVLLCGIFLAFSGVAIYGAVMGMKAWIPPLNEEYDVAELDNQILVARHAIAWETPDFLALAEQAFQKNLEEGKYKLRPDFNPDYERRLLAEQLSARWRVVGPYQQRQFKFSNILCDRSEGSEVQIRYKARITNYAEDEIFRAVWLFGNPQEGTEIKQVPTRHTVGRWHTMSIPASCVSESGTLLGAFVNQNPFEGQRQQANVIEFYEADTVEVLFVVGSFEGNLIRLLALIECKLLFLAAVAVLMASVFSYPVACVTSLTVFVLVSVRSFMAEAFDWATRDGHLAIDSLEKAAMYVLYYLYTTLTAVIPDFSHYDGIESFVSGRNVTLMWVLQGVGLLGIVQTGFVLMIAILLFHRREVSEVSV